MRVIARVVGVGERKSGFSKRTQRNYDFTEVSIAYPDSSFVGEKCETLPFDSSLIANRILAPGDVLELVMHQANFRTYVDAIL